MLLKHEGIAAGEGRAESVALLGSLGENTAPVVLLILGLASQPPAGIDIPRPPAHTDGIRLFPVLKLVRIRLGEQAVKGILLCKGPGIESGTGVDAPVLAHSCGPLNTDGPQLNGIGGVHRHGPSLGHGSCRTEEQQ